MVLYVLYVTRGEFPVQLLHRTGSSPRAWTKGGESMIKRLILEEEGQTLVEYGLLVSLIALVVIAILTVLGQKVRNLFVTVNSNITSST